MHKTHLPVAKRRVFSFGWCLAAAFMHFALTFAIAGIHFVVGMGAFTHNVSSEVIFWKSVQWIWTPLAMAAWDPQNMHNDGQLIGLAFLWSCCVGVVAGFAVQAFLRWLDRPLYPPPTPSDKTRRA